MRAPLIALAGLATAVLAALAGAAEASAPPALRAKQDRARGVLAQVDALDVRFGRVVDEWDGARIQLEASRRRLAANARSLRKARWRSRAADRRLGQRLVAIYEGGEPTIVDVVTGAANLSDLLDRLEAADALAGYDRRVADAARRSRERLVSARRELQATERTRRAAVAELAAERRQIGAMLARRRRLLASVQSQVAELRRQEAARQQALAAAARARLAREQALRAREAAARAATKRAASSPTATTTTPPATTVPPAAATTLAAQPPPAPATTAAEPPPPPATTAAATTVAPPASTPSPGAGHPEAAVIALRYLGVRYRWGGASPATGFDCSGLVMYVYAQLGIQLPHQSAAQYGYGAPVARDQLQPGDLVFYDGLSHVAIYIGNGQVVHAPRTGDVVRIVPLSQGGGSYVGARRIAG
jgi:cell wall-associated NlpC family hydrolase